MKSIIEFFHHLFVPRHTNNYRAKLLHHDILTVYLIFALTMTLGIAKLQSQQGSILGYATDISIDKLMALTNAERSKADLPAFTYNDKLAQAATAKAEDMFGKNYWAHYGPTGETPWQFILGAGYQYEYAGENLAKNFLFSDGVVSAWMASPTHRENILRKEYTDIGCAIKNGVLNGEETTLVVQMFGRPLYASNAAPQEEKQTETSVVGQEKSVAPQEVQSKDDQIVLARDTQKTAFFPVYFNLNMLFFAILIIALLFDFYFAAKLNIINLKGKNLIHILFLAFIAIGAFILVKGSII